MPLKIIDHGTKEYQQMVDLRNQILRKPLGLEFTEADLEKEKEDNTIFELASGGFESTVRLAKSNPKMWLPIFIQNKENVLDVLNEHIAQLKKFKACLEKENFDYLDELMKNANTIRRILK